MFPDLEEFYIVNKPAVSWQTAVGYSKEKIICAYIPNGTGANMKIIYDPLMQKVTDRYGHELKFIPKPSQRIFSLFKDQVARSEPPSWFREEQKFISLKSEPDIKFDESRSVWFHHKTGKICAGFSPPLIDNVTYDVITSS